MATKQLRIYSKKNFEELKAVTCDLMLRTVHVKSELGDMALCCTTWMPHNVGNINETTILEYLRSETHKNILATSMDGTFSYCDKEICPEIQCYLKTGSSGAMSPVETAQKTLDKKFLFIIFTYDKSCNLQCPSCRNELFIQKTYSDEFKKTHANMLRSLDELLAEGYKLGLCITGSGDPFVSKAYKEILKSYRNTGDYKFFINSNGVLLTQKVLEWENIQHRAKSFDISIDAYTEDTYNIVRKGGSFSKLKRNLTNLNQQISAGFFSNSVNFQTNFIVSATNFREMADFVKWQINDFENLSRTWLNCIADWGHFKPGQFKSLTVWDKDHPDHAEFLKVLEDPIFKHPKVHLGNLSKFVK